MASLTESVEFTTDHVDDIVQAMTRPGVAWVNVVPVLDGGLEMAMTRSRFSAWVSARGPALPLVTWSAPTGGRKPSLAQLGLSHPRGNKALDQLAEAGFALRPGWVKRGDHPKNGIVIDLPADDDVAQMLRWALGAADHLSRVILDELWLAKIYSN